MASWDEGRKNDGPVCICVMSPPAQHTPPQSPERSASVCSQGAHLVTTPGQSTPSAHGGFWRFQEEVMWPSGRLSNEISPQRGGGVRSAQNLSPPPSVEDIVFFHFTKPHSQSPGGDLCLWRYVVCSSFGAFHAPPLPSDWSLTLVPSHPTP